MRVEWHGQAAFTLSGEEGTVVIDPFGDVSSFRERGIQWDYPPIAVPAADLVLITHEHRDHNGVEVVGGEPAVVRAQDGTHESPIGEVLGIASEHDDVGGDERGPNTIFAFTLDDRHVVHFGDFGQAQMRPEQREAIGDNIDLLFLPVGGGPTIGAEAAARIVDELQPLWVVPMHYRTERIGFLGPADEFIAGFDEPLRLGTPSFETGELPQDGGPTVVVPAAP
jgi:L-ascorbate metabolism protein UlaG (beta-lactamase superfamily)